MVDILIKPVITEKMTRLGDKLNRFAFLVDKNANKIQIKKAVEQFYNVNVESVNTLIRPAKAKSRFTKAGALRGKTKVTKKAIVTLAKGETIDFYNNI